MSVGSCKDCTDRVVGCHATCEKYLTCKREHDKEREEILRIKKRMFEPYYSRKRRYEKL